MTLQAGEHAGSDSSHSPLRWQKGRAPRMTAEWPHAVTNFDRAVRQLSLRSRGSVL